MLEHPPQLNIIQSELAPRVADYFDNLLAQRDAILARYSLTPETAEEFCNLRSTAEDREKILVLYERMVYVIENKQIPPLEKQEKYRLVQENMGEEFFGIEAIEKTFGIHLDISDIPDIPFSFADLKRAKDLNQFLILRVDKTDDGIPLTMEQMEQMLTDTFDSKSEGKIIHPHTLGRREIVAGAETPRFSWALVSHENIPDSTKKNYLEQTVHLIDYFKYEVYQGNQLPPIWQSAIDEFEQEKDTIDLLIKTHQQEAVTKLERLSITSLMRHTPVELLYDCLVYFMNTEVRLWKNFYTWTCGCGSAGRFVFAGRFSSDGMLVDRFNPGTSNEYIGVAFSRLR